MNRSLALNQPVGLETETFELELRNLIYYVGSTYFQLIEKAKTKLKFL